VQGQFDEYGAIGFREREGFREHSRENTEILFADLGYKFSEQVENRFYITMDRTNRNLPVGLPSQKWKTIRRSERCLRRQSPPGNSGSRL
jgi:hypothetical protein